MNRIDEALILLSAHRVSLRRVNYRDTSVIDRVETLLVEAVLDAVADDATHPRPSAMERIRDLSMDVQRAGALIQRAVDGIDCDDAVESAPSDAEPAASAAEGNDCDDELWPGWWERDCDQWLLLGANFVHVTRSRERWFTFGVTREDGSTEPYGGEGHPTAGDAMLAVQRALVGGAK